MKNETGSEPKFKTKTSVAAEPALRELFLDGIMDIYWAENHLVKNLPKMAKEATSTELAKAIENHLKETVEHVNRLEEVFALLGEKAIAKKCDAMEGLTKEGEGIIESTTAQTATRDVGIILAAQKVEHYEIATYGGLYQLAVTLGLDEVANLLEQTLIEEKAADQLLTEVAENNINYQAADEA
ncbi:MAG TPA: ferritin-like domain-containing protein [Pseudosphingobacterium sp.]|nr:ferritin-like domain-containing protein [Pseudosphingobacterium sp.]